MLTVVEGIIEVAAPQTFEGRRGDSASASVAQPSTNGEASGAFLDGAGEKLKYVS